MSALTSLIRLATASGLGVALFFVAVSDVEPFISHADGLVDALEDSNPEKQDFRVGWTGKGNIPSPLAG